MPPTTFDPMVHPAEREQAALQAAMRERALQQQREVIRQQALAEQAAMRAKLRSDSERSRDMAAMQLAEREQELNSRALTNEQHRQALEKQLQQQQSAAQIEQGLIEAQQRKLEEQRAAVEQAAEVWQQEKEALLQAWKEDHMRLRDLIDEKTTPSLPAAAAPAPAPVPSHHSTRFQRDTPADDFPIVSPPKPPPMPAAPLGHPSTSCFSPQSKPKARPNNSSPSPRPLCSSPPPALNRHLVRHNSPHTPPAAAPAAPVSKAATAAEVPPVEASSGSVSSGQSPQDPEPRPTQPQPHSHDREPAIGAVSVTHAGSSASMPVVQASQRKPVPVSSPHSPQDPSHQSQARRRQGRKLSSASEGVAGIPALGELNPAE